MKNGEAIMCGISGYIGHRQASPIIAESLKRLEYRGYDSVGVAVMSDRIHVLKGVGQVDNFSFDSLKGTIGIGHTRWATHGGVTKENAHPHLSNNELIAIVHNGIIENYQEIKAFLISQGFNFRSDTDTEVIPNLIEYHMKRYDFIEATTRALKHLEGQYAIAVMGFNKIVVVRKELPLVIGVGDGEFYVASDILAFLNQTKNVIFLAEKDMAVLDDKLEIRSLMSGERVDREVSQISSDEGQVGKGGYDHYFIKEILEQADALERVLTIDQSLIKDIASEIKKAQGTYIVACGSSYNATLYALYLFSKVAKCHINTCIASEFAHFQHFLTSNSLVLAISQSGETADILGAIRVAKAVGAKVISITNVIGSSLARESDKLITQRVGYEISVAATKSYTAQLVILYMLAYEIAGRLEEGKGNLKELIRYIYYLVSDSARKYTKNLAVQLRYAEHIYLIGRGLDFSTAQEAALKIKEISYIHAEAYMGGELKHGAIALMEYGTPCIVFVSGDKDIISNAIELKARGAYIIGVGSKNNEVFDYFIKVRDIPDLSPVCQIIPMQFLAYMLAILRGCDPDKPRNLAKSVTVK